SYHLDLHSFPTRRSSDLSAFGCAVIKDASNMEAAKAMVNYIMSKEGQNYLGEKLGTIRFTNRNAEYETPYLPETSEVNWVDRDVDRKSTRLNSSHVSISY